MLHRFYIRMGAAGPLFGVVHGSHSRRHLLGPDRAGPILFNNQHIHLHTTMVATR